MRPNETKPLAYSERAPEIIRMIRKYDITNGKQIFVTGVTFESYFFII